MTDVTEAEAQGRLFAGMRRPLVSVITTLYYVAIYFSSSSVVSLAFSALYSKFGHHPQLLGYLCAAYSFADSIAELAHGENRVLTHSITHLAKLI